MYLPHYTKQTMAQNTFVPLRDIFLSFFIIEKKNQQVENENIIVIQITIYFILYVHISYSVHEHKEIFEGNIEFY